MCKELCAAGLTKPSVKFKLSKEERASLPGKESNKLKKDMTPDEYQEHRIFKRAYEQVRRDFFASLENDEYAEYQKEYHRRYQLNHYEELLKPYAEKYFEANPDRHMKTYRRRRARKANVVREKYTRQMVIDKWGTVCYLCNEEIDMEAPAHKLAGENWHFGMQLDHVIPIIANGPDTLDNVKPVHAICNLRKPKGKYLRDKTELDKLELQGKKLEKKYRDL